jgi:hypothetical protein
MANGEAVRPYRSFDIRCSPFPLVRNTARIASIFRLYLGLSDERLDVMDGQNCTERGELVRVALMAMSHLM